MFILRLIIEKQKHNILTCLKLALPISANSYFAFANHFLVRYKRNNIWGKYHKASLVYTYLIRNSTSYILPIVFKYIFENYLSEYFPIFNFRMKRIIFGEAVDSGNFITQTYYREHASKGKKYKY